MIHSDADGEKETPNTNTKTISCSLRSQEICPDASNFRFINEPDAEAFLSTPLPPQPDCFPPNNPAVWIEWCYYSWRHNSKQLPLEYYCEDCTPDYQKLMRRSKRCAYPGAIEVWRWVWYDGKQENKIHSINGEYQVFMARPGTRFFSYSRNAEVPAILDEIKVMQEAAREF